MLAVASRRADQTSVAAVTDKVAVVDGSSWIERKPDCVGMLGKKRSLRSEMDYADSATKENVVDQSTVAAAVNAAA